MSLRRGGGRFGIEAPLDFWSDVMTYVTWQGCLLRRHFAWAPRFLYETAMKTVSPKRRLFILIPLKLIFFFTVIQDTIQDIFCIMQTNISCDIMETRYRKCIKRPLQVNREKCLTPRTWPECKLEPGSCLQSTNDWVLKSSWGWGKHLFVIQLP